MKNITVILILLLVINYSNSYCQFQIKLISVENAQDSKKPLDFGKLINLKLTYQIPKDHTIEQALNYLQKYFLIINGVPYPDKKIQNMQIVYNRKKEEIFFEVLYQTKLPDAYVDKDGKQALSEFWSQQYQPFHAERSLKASLLSTNQDDQEINSVDIKLKFYEWWRVALFIILFGGLLWFTLAKAAKYQYLLLRDDKGGCQESGKLNRFSLSRVQVFAWTFVIFGLFAYLWAVTDFLPTITAAHLVLLGIAAGQRILAQIIDSQKPPEKITLLATGETKCSVSFFTDLISDDTGLSITRLQYLIITAIFLIVFIVNAIEKLQLIDFSVEQLALMGTSAGLYLWNKKLDQQEKPKPNP